MNKRALEESLKYVGSWLTYRYGQEDIPGYAVAVAHKGKVLFSQAYGYADLEKKTRLTTDHIFRIASHSKTFTATALMQLQEQGLLRIDDHVADYLVWLKEHRDTRWHNVTIRQLMSHGAGVIRDGLDADYWQLERPFPSESELQKEMLEADLVIDNNIKLKYSNFGYSLLGMVIESVSKQTYNDYVTEHIVNELKLTRTGPEYTTAIDGQIVTGYTQRDVNKTRLPIAQIDTRAMAAATGFYSTLEDLCMYFSAQMVGSKKLLTDESKKEMQRTQFHAHSPGEQERVDYGLGMEIENVNGRRLLGHGGGFPGHITKSMFDPKDELVVIVLTNYLNSPATTIAKGVFAVIDYYQKNTPTTKPKHDHNLLAGRYMSLWGMTDIVVTGDKIVGSYANSWYPLYQPEELECVDETTFKVGETDSFLSEGELVTFNMKNGQVETVTYNGTTMWPEKAWIKKQSDRSSVSLHSD